MRFIVQDEPSPILGAASQNGSWSVPRSVLINVAEVEKCSLAGCADVFDVLWVLVLHNLKCPEKVAIDILEAQGAALQGAQTGFAELLACDEAQACLDGDDKEDFKKQQDVANTEMLETDEFSRAWVTTGIKVTEGDMRTAKKLALMKYKGGKQTTKPPWGTWINRWLTLSSPPTATFGGAGQRTVGAQDTRSIQ